MKEKQDMANCEHTPLLQTVIVAPPRPRYPHSTLRRFCTIALVTSLIIIVALFLLPFAIDGPRPHWHHRHRPFLASFSSSSPSQLPSDAWPLTQGIPYEELQQILLTTPEEAKAREWSQYYTAGPHLAGKNLSQAIFTKERWEEFGIASEIVSYDVYVNYPLGHRLALLEKSDTSAEGALEEDVLEKDHTSGLADRIPTFHGYSASGNVTASYVYVNYGTFEDFNDLVKANVSLAGKIALAKYGRIFRGLKVKHAQEHGMVGTIIYSDPGDDGEVTEKNGYALYPDGPARQPSSVQRGSTQFLSNVMTIFLLGVAPGDPTTPGYPSKPGVPRQEVNGSIPSIPSIPISYLDALPLLKALNGHGPKASSINKWWLGGGLDYKGVEYNIGPSPEGLALHLVNEQEYVTTPMWNVIGIINGSIPDEVVILGNHRDAWVAGGAGDPNSGSATLNEVARSFGNALEAGWKPLRTIVLASWDGEEYGLIGSTEWVEEYLPWLSKTAVAYLNVDVSTAGPRFKASASPLLNKALYEATSLVQSPNQTVSGQTIRDTWSGHISTMGSGSDFTAFQDFAGIPSLDMGFAGGSEDAVYHYHSNYDSFDWMDKFGDPGFHYHVAVSKLWSILAASIVEKPLLHLNATNYATGLQNYLKAAKDKADQSAPKSAESPEISSFRGAFRHLEYTLHRLFNASVEFDAYAAYLEESLGEDIPWWKWWEKVRLYWQIRRTNDKYKYLERQFLYLGGLDGRSWFKHVVFAPGLHTGYAGVTFPGLVENIEAGQWDNATVWSHIIEDRVEAAIGLLHLH
ncbi:glutamate carboxypeptidase [Xylona heveae TC161]|uniref:Glutamate carboxypeptidase n=1 Tax=Xylona heveae (strain CBS 132557 / TC161) TaxID=1328760 RepID=A0A161TEQ9_XYLHT|nr:glutamate carboxypeptidase [Xylona heveae TC161]KZF24437.1 glutamate carboxypeptidase [Xylona heveae TC161]